MERGSVVGRVEKGVSFEWLGGDPVLRSKFSRLLVFLHASSSGLIQLNMIDLELDMFVRLFSRFIASF